MDNDQAQLLGEIHATVKSIDKRLDDHQGKIEKIEKRQVALFAWFAGVGVAVGGSASAFLKKLGVL